MIWSAVPEYPKRVISQKRADHPQISFVNARLRSLSFFKRSSSLALLALQFDVVNGAPECQRGSADLG